MPDGDLTGVGLVKRPRTVETCWVRRRSPPALPPVTTVDIEGLLAQDDLRALLDACEHTGSIRAPEVSDIVETHELTGLEQEALVRELDKRGIEIVETGARGSPAPDRADARRDDDGRPAAVPSRGRPPSPPHRGAGGGAGKADRARRRRREGADDPVEPATGRLDREELPQPGPAVPRSHPGGHARPHPRRREVRLAPGLQVLDLRDLVDPPGGRARARRQGPHDPDAGAHRRADAEDQPGRAVALDAARARADARGDRRGGLPHAAADRRGACRGAGVHEPRRARRRPGRCRVRRLRRRRRAAPRGDGRGAHAQAGAAKRACTRCPSGSARWSRSATASTAASLAPSRRSGAASGSRASASARSSSNRSAASRSCARCKPFRADASIGYGRVGLHRARRRSTS